MKGHEVIQSLRARLDLIEIFRYYTRETGLDAARRFYAQADATFERLAAMPGLGARYEPELPGYPSLRFAPISRFKTYLVFYRPIEGGIEVVRVLHGSRDISSLLGEDFEVERGANAIEEGE